MIGRHIDCYAAPPAVQKTAPILPKSLLFPANALIERFETLCLLPYEFVISTGIELRQFL